MTAPFNSGESRVGAGALAEVKRRPARGPKRKWTREENDRIAALYEGGMRPKQIALEFNTTPEAIKGKIKEWGIGGRFRRSA